MDWLKIFVKLPVQKKMTELLSAEVYCECILSQECLYLD